MPRRPVDPVGLAFAGVFVLEVPVHRQAEGGHGRAGLGVAQLGVTGQPAHDYDVIEHGLLPPQASLLTMMERMTLTLIRIRRSSSAGNAGSAEKVIRT